MSDTVEVAENGMPVTRDRSLDMSAMLKSSKATVVEEPTEQEESPLQRLKRQKEENGLGMVVNTSDLEAASSEKPLKMSKAVSDGEESVDAYLKEMDATIEASKKVQFSRTLANPKEAAQAMTTLENIGKLNEKAKAEGKELVEEGKTVMIDVDGETSAAGEMPAKAVSLDDANAQVYRIPEDADTNPLPPISEEKQAIVNILIDKTGFEEEKSRIFKASKINITEVEDVDLSSIKVIAPKKSFVDSVSELELSSMRVPIAFPASRFRAYMTGLSYGEMIDLQLSTENVTKDQLEKRLTVIYNKMVNPSCGKFESFEDFLRKFSYVDIDLAIYGLVIATFPEMESMNLECKRKGCGYTFSHRYSPRSVIEFESADEQFLKIIEEISDCPADKANDLFMQSPTRTHKRFKLPHSGFIVEVGVASCYEWLYNVMDNLLGDTFQQKHADDINNILQLNTYLLSLVMGVFVPTKNGGYLEYHDFEDMIQALYMIKPDEVPILTGLLDKYNRLYSISFGIHDIECPYCHEKTARLPITPDEMVFMKYQAHMSTDYDLSSVALS